MNRSHRRRLLAAVLLALPGTTQALLAPGMVDTFQDGTTNGWTSGLAHPHPPANVASGGPAGSGDRFLLVTSSGTDAGAKLVAISGPQWAGNYLLAGVTGIAMDLRNFGLSDLSLRLYFESPGGNALSAGGFLLAAGSDWTRAIFPTEIGALVGPEAAALSGATQFRLYHGPAASFPGPEIVAQLGVDNVTAVPEPGTWLSLGLGLGVIAAGGALRARRRHPRRGGPPRQRAVDRADPRQESVP